MPTEVRATGPLFDGQAARIMTQYCRAVEMTIADLGVNRVKDFLGQRFVYDPPPDNPGYYQEHIRTERQINSAIVTDDQVVYGPWLEGVGSRNYPVTRFRGYHAFRMVTLGLNAIAGEIADREFALFEGQINGI